jgi:hypothetical protein
MQINRALAPPPPGHTETERYLNEAPTALNGVALPLRGVGHGGLSAFISVHQ